MTKFFAVVFFILPCILSGCAGYEDQSQQAFAVDAETLHSLEFSPDAKSIAVCAESEGKVFVVRDGAAIGARYNSVIWKGFAPSGNSLVFLAAENGKKMVIRDGVQLGGAYDDVRNFRFDSTGQNCWFVARNNGREFLVRNGVQVGGTYGSFARTPLQVSPDGTACFAVADVGGRDVLTRNGITVKGPFDQIQGVNILDEDGSSLVFAVTENGQTRVLLDGKQLGRAYTFVRDIVISQSRDTVAVLAGDMDLKIPFDPDKITTVVCVNGKQIASMVGKNGKLFGVHLSTDGRSVAYLESRDGLIRAVKDGRQVGGAYAKVRMLTLSRDGRQVAFVARDVSGQEHVLLNGRQVGQKYSSITELRLSPCGSSVAFCARTDNGSIVIKDGKQVGDAYSFAAGLTFGPGGQSLAFLGATRLAENGAWKGWVLVKNGVQVTGPYDEMIGPLGTTDSDALNGAVIRDTTVFRVRVNW
jgi:hypothetical protein